MHKVSLLLILTLLLVNCAPTPTPARSSAISFIEVTGDQATRVERIDAILVQGGTLPTPLQDAQFVEVKIGDGELGPADSRAYIMLEVAPDEIEAWRALLSPLAQTPQYAAPEQPYAWWVDEARFASLAFYAPDALTNRTNGWIAIDATRGQIFIYTFTT